MVFMPTTSTLSLYSPLSITPIIIGVVEKRGLCSDGLLQMEKVGMRLYHINFISLLTTFEEGCAWMVPLLTGSG
jgi:hypothetical protein